MPLNRLLMEKKE